MDASPTLFVELLGSPAYRMVIPVYQRAYSWDEEQCIQLWDDILSVGRREGDRHFTGSVVWIQDGTAAAAGITKRLLIDGQQRITTLMLILIALARFARTRQEFEFDFSPEEILAQFLVHCWKKGDDHYKLTLSQGDRSTLCSLIDNLENPDAVIDESSSRLIGNLELFENRLAKLESPAPIWFGIQRLEIVSISLAQGQDNPQLIFESMNSTGKDLSSADLIRNFVIMAQPIDKQDELYRNYWRKIEEALGADSYDTIFDNFVSAYLTVLYAPESLLRRNIYPLFKRHVIENGYNDDSRIVELLREMRDYAQFYAAIIGGLEPDPNLRQRFANLRRLDVSVVNPLLLSLYADYKLSCAFSHKDFLAMLDILESYLFRRATCEYPTNSLNKYFSSLIARLGKVKNDGGPYREAITAFLLNERERLIFPQDAEFEQALETRNIYRFRRAFYLLARLENSYHAKMPIDFSAHDYTIEHIAPQNSLAHQEWRDALGLNEDQFETFVHTLGNLTLTGYNSELSDGTFAQKKNRAVGGYQNQPLSLSNELHNADHWDVELAYKRGRRLAKQALNVWPRPNLSKETLANYKFKGGNEDGHKRKVNCTFQTLISKGLLKPGDELFSSTSSSTAIGTITENNHIRLTTGEEFTSPSRAAHRACELIGGGSNQWNGWQFWKTPNGKLLAELRSDVTEMLVSEESDAIHQRINFWDGFFDYCSGLDWFVDRFGNQSNRWANRGCSAGFGSKTQGYYFHAVAMGKDGNMAANVCCNSLEFYKPLLARKDKISTRVINELSCTPAWDKEDEKKKGRRMIVCRPFNPRADDWDEAYRWLALALRTLNLIVQESIQIE